MPNLFDADELTNLLELFDQNIQKAILHMSGLRKLTIEKGQPHYWLQESWTRYNWIPDLPFPPLISKEGWWIEPYYHPAQDNLFFVNTREATPEELATAEIIFADQVGQYKPNS